GRALSKDAIIIYLLNEPFNLEIKDSRYQIRPDRSGLTGVEIVLDLPPVGIASEGDEKVRFPILPDDGHGIVVKCFAVPRTVGESRRQNGDSLAHFSPPTVLASLYLLHSNTMIRSASAPTPTSLV